MTQPLSARRARGRGLSAQGRWARNPLLVLISDRLALLSAGVLVALILVAVLAPRVAPSDPAVQDIYSRLKPPGSKYLLGTDHLGRDVLSRAIWGSRVSLQVGIVAVAVALISGASLGIISGYSGGRIDDLIMRAVDILLALPTILLALLIVSVLGPSVTNAMIAIGISQAPNYARVARAATLVVRELAYVEAARAIGASDGRILRHHVLPNIVSPLIVMATLGLGTAILSEATLSFLGVGVQPPIPSWGSMLNDARIYFRIAPWLSILPGIAIMITVLAFNLLGDGLQDVMDPRSGIPGRGGVSPR